MPPDPNPTSAPASSSGDLAPARRAPPEISDALLDSDAVKVVRRLRRAGHQTYLVGGCVRDLLLGQRPKDFDVATAAHPHQVKETFRNCRLIGRRFRLAHVYFRGGKVIEVSTFRSNPLDAVAEAGALPQDLLIRADNVFGTEEEDARRRDFTINGLFYDVDDGKVVDHVGGKDDLAARCVRTIGKPDVRMREDPVRILRAIRFAAKCNLDLEPETLAALKAHAHEIPRCAPPRVLEELLKLMRSGAARRCVDLLSETGVLKILLPPLAAHLALHGEPEHEKLRRALEALDAHVRADEVPSDSVLLATLLWPLPREGAPHGPIPKGPPVDNLKAPGDAAAAESASAELNGDAAPGEPLAARPAAPDDEIDPDLLALERALEDGEEDDEDAGDGEGDEGDDGEESDDEAPDALAEGLVAAVQAPLPGAALRKMEELHDERLAAAGIATFTLGGGHEPAWTLPQTVVPAELVLTEMVRTARLPRRVAERCRLILSVQAVLLGDGTKRRRFSTPQLARQSIFPEALAVLELSVAATGQGADALAKWQAVFASQPPPQPEPELLPRGEGGERPRRRRRGGGGGGRRRRGK